MPAGPSDPSVLGAGASRTDPASASTPLRDAGVLVPVYRDDAGDVRIVVIRRTEGGLHGGQLAFPGGTRDARDASLLETALREAEEEIGLARADVRPLAELPVIETSITGFRIAPYLGAISRPAAWRPSAREVAEILEARVADLAVPAAHGERLERHPTWPRPHLVSFYRLGSHRLWGASYRILHPLLPRLLAGEWSL